MVKRTKTSDDGMINEAINGHSWKVHTVFANKRITVLEFEKVTKSQHGSKLDSGWNMMTMAEAPGTCTQKEDSKLLI